MGLQSKSVPEFKDVCTDLPVGWGCLQFDEFPIIKPSPSSGPTMYGLLAVIDEALQLVTLGHPVRKLQDSAFEVGNGDATCASFHLVSLWEIRSREILMTPALCFMTVDKPLKIRLPAYSLQAGFITLNPGNVQVPVLLPPSATAGNLPRCELPGPIWLQYLQGQVCQWPVEDVATYMNQDRRNNWSDLVKTQYGTRLLCMCRTLTFILVLKVLLSCMH